MGVGDREPYVTLCKQRASHTSQVRLENDDAESSVAEPSLGCGPLDDYALVAR